MRPDCICPLGPDKRPQVFVNNKLINRARHILEQELGRPIRPGFSALHICDTRGCINKEHIYEGNHSDNIIDSYDAGRITFNAQKTHCPQGHEYTPENTEYRRRSRRCRTCHREQEYNRRHRGL